MIAVLSGGVGGARFLRGLREVAGGEPITAIVNTGDDIELHGLHISPDLDIVAYTLSGLVDEERGWGIRGDTFKCLEALKGLGEETWFQLGDRDLATHMLRTALLRQGLPLHEATARLCQRLGVPGSVRLLPMTNERVESWIEVNGGAIHFQEYLVKRQMQDAVKGVTVRGVERAQPAPGVLEVLQEANPIIFAPSNPIVSIGPILALPGVRQALGRVQGRVAAISPIVAGAPLKGPADRLMTGLGLEVSALQVARLYQGVVGLFVLDVRDRKLRPAIEQLGMNVFVTETIMRGPGEWAALAAGLLKALRG